VAAALREDTILVSVMHANNEIGTVNDIAGIGEVTRNAGVLFHVDAAQSAGKIPIDMEAMKVDLMSLSGHKMYGPKGIGCLFVRRKPRVRLEAQMHGGGHERGMRSGTLATHQIVGMGEAARIAREGMADEAERLRALRHRFWDGIKDIEEIHINGDQEQRLPGAINVSIAFVEGESLIMSLKDLAVSSGSACTSASLEPSYVLRALGLNDELAHSSLRFSFGRFTSSLPRKTWTWPSNNCERPLRSCANCPPCGTCTRTALIWTASNGPPTRHYRRNDKMAYSDKVLDHYENPRNVGKLDAEDNKVGTGMVGAPACGDVMRLQIKVNDDGVIEDAKFKTYGCGSACTSASLEPSYVLRALGLNDELAHSSLRFSFGRFTSGERPSRQAGAALKWAFPSRKPQQSMSPASWRAGAAVSVSAWVLRRRGAQAWPMCWNSSMSNSRRTRCSRITG
jgi:cysteine sulfinate desulfinase/cysteine desulfurase-like protein